VLVEGVVAALGEWFDTDVTTFDGIIEKTKFKLPEEVLSKILVA
jgi:hypothetical protein